MLACFGLVAAPSFAFHLGGSVRLFWVDSEIDNAVENESVEQQLRLDLTQELSPYLSLRLAVSELDYDSTVDGSDFSRRFRQPRLDLFYSRPKLTARLGYEYRLADGTIGLDNFEARGLDGSLSWDVRPDLLVSVSFRDDINEADVAALGRDTESRQARVEVLYRRQYWLAGYSYSRGELENTARALDSIVDRHEVRLQASRGFLDERLSLGFSGLVGHSDRRLEVGRGAGLGEPVPALQGLFAVDLTPAVGELEPAPGLIDGDTDEPASPVIEIGGGNTFRNIGLDLGITRPVSRLEISVDRPSGSSVAWEVYRSRDNLFWEQVVGVAAQYDNDLLRYTLLFQEVADRFFKAVNVSTNPAADVRVTELRALSDIDLESRDLEADLHRLNMTAGYRFSPRVRGSLALASSKDEASAAGVAERSRRVDSASAGLDIDLAQSLRLDLRYRWSDSDLGIDRPLERTTSESSAALSWTPLPTFDAVLRTSVRDERERDFLLQRTVSTRLGVGMELLPDLDLYSDLTFSSIDDPFAGFDRDSWSWSQRLRSRPLPSWSLGAGYSILETERRDLETVFKRRSLFVDTTWNPGTYLTMTGAWRFFDEGDDDSLRQTYGLFYTPGEKLSLSATWGEFDSDLGRETASSSVGLTYRLYRRVLLAATLSRSRSLLAGGLGDEVKSFQSGLTIGF